MKGILIRFHKAQSTLEYAALFAIVIGALIAGQVYVKRGLQGKIKKSADQLGDQYSFSSTTGTVTTVLNSSTDETISGGVTTTESDQDQSITQDLSIGDFDSESWE